MTNSRHFEELWEQCEKYHTSITGVSTIIDELLLKINLYQTIDKRVEIPEDDRKKIKSRTMGEILFTITSLSIKDNINVYEALNNALQIRQ
jgi:hypothetical protein